MMSTPGVPNPAWWPSELTDRQRVLLHAQPLFDQRRNDGNQPEEARHYDSLALALRVLEIVLEASGLEDTVTSLSVRDALAPALTAMDQQAGIAPQSERHARVVERILGGLLNDTERRRPFAIPYTAADDAGGIVTRNLEFRLLQEAHHGDGTIVLRATTEGANLYLRALALDLESQQAATEAIIELQLRRGRFQDAVDGARQAKQQSIRYGDLLRDRLDQTRRNLANVDWRVEMPTLLTDAQVHLETRLEVEDRILAATDARLEALELGTDAAQQVGRVRKLLTDCRRRHHDLHGLVLGSRQTFLREQARQTFIPRLLVTRPEMGSEVLEPVLAGNIVNMLPLCERALTLCVPAGAPGVLWLADLLEWQLQPRRPAEVMPPDDAERDLVPVSEEHRYFPPEIQTEGEAVLAGVTEPTTLDRLLQQPRSVSAARPVRDYIVLRALQAAAPEPPALEDHDPALPILHLRATADGQFSTPEYAGDNLLLQPHVPVSGLPFSPTPRLLDVGE
jgi:hypothetical protein